MWQRIRAMQMFLEHVLMKHSEVSVAYARRLDFVSLSVWLAVSLLVPIQIYKPFDIQLLSGDSDFLKASTLEDVRKFVITTHKEVKKHRCMIKRLCAIIIVIIISPICTQSFQDYC